MEQNEGNGPVMPSPETRRPPIPDTGWEKPQFIDFSDAKVLGIDCETYDPQLPAYGPGWARESGLLLGVSISDGTQSAYYPVRHPLSHNFDVAEVLSYISREIRGKTIVGANLAYDFGWLLHEGLEWDYASERLNLWDCQYAEAILLPGHKVGLDRLAKRYLGESEGKETEQLYQWLRHWHGAPARLNPRAFIYTAPSVLVGPYAEADASLPVRIYKKQKKRAKNVDGFYDLIRMECSLIPLYLRMRKQGVGVDIPGAAQVEEHLREKAAEAQEQLDDHAGFAVNVNANADLAKLWEMNGWPIAQTEKGAPSFTKEILQASDVPMAAFVLDLRRYEKIRGTFVENYLLKASVGGRVYAQFHPLPSHGKGAITGRFSSSNPNLQNIPSRDAELAPMVRGLFIPFKKKHLWHRFDYDQIEYRLLANFAVGNGSEALRARYTSDPNVDYHTAVQGNGVGENGQGDSSKAHQEPELWAAVWDGQGQAGADARIVSIPGKGILRGVSRCRALCERHLYGL